MADLTNWNTGQGESWGILVDIAQGSGSLPLDITDYMFSGQIRENFTTDIVAATFEITKLSPFVSGSIFIKLAPSQTLILDQRRYVYDVNMSSGSDDTSRRILEGQFAIRPAATK